MTDDLSKSAARTAEIYRKEKELADRIRAAGSQERPHLYSAVYDELFRSFPDHPQLVFQANAAAKAAAVAERLKLLRPYLRPNSALLEIGPGDCSLAAQIARYVRKVYAVEASAEIGTGTALPPNVELIIAGGCAVPVPQRSIDVAYSDQLFEHLHPEDASEHLKHVYRALAPSGIYICFTPNRLSGPHDISRGFDDVATGLHLREYTATELAAAFRAAGFERVQLLAGARGFQMSFPLALVSGLERLLGRLPKRVARPLARSLPFRILLGIKLVGKKADH